MKTSKYILFLQISAGFTCKYSFTLCINLQFLFLHSFLILFSSLVIKELHNSLVISRLYVGPLALFWPLSFFFSFFDNRGFFASGSLAFSSFTKSSLSFSDTHSKVTFNSCSGIINLKTNVAKKYYNNIRYLLRFYFADTTLRHA